MGHHDAVPLPPCVPASWVRCPLHSASDLVRKVMKMMLVNASVRGEPPGSELQSRAARDATLVAPGVLIKVIEVSTADPQRAGIKPASFVRQVLAVCLHPELLTDSQLPLDVRQRAHRLLQVCDGGSVGSYSASSGLLYCRQRISDYITRRDGVPCDPHDVFISAGSQRALLTVMKLISGGEGATQSALLTPLPCPHTLPPLLDATGIAAVPYRLSEERGWAVDLEELHRALRSTRGQCRPRAIYISNPGNPTGHVQERSTMEEVIRFAAAERLLLLVDEMDQLSVHAPGRQFLSYKKVLFEMEPEFSQSVELFSIHSLSGAHMGECGLRAGYLEAVNMDPGVKHFLDNILCGDISCPVTGQLALEVALHPPEPGDASYNTYAQEALLSRATLSHNAQRAQELLNALPGLSCQPVGGGVYMYPHLDLPATFRQRAQTLEVEADVLYCQQLLEEEGVVMGTGQDGGPPKCHHLRLCLLVPPETLEEVLARLGSFHLRLLEEHRPLLPPAVTHPK